MSTAAFLRRAERAALLDRIFETSPAFASLAAAEDFRRGYVVDRVTVRLSSHRFAVVSPSTARRHGLEIVGGQ